MLRTILNWFRPSVAEAEARFAEAAADLRDAREREKRAILKRTTDDLRQSLGLSPYNWSK